uniref:Uncharacterized protein n=1 Tax=viral metagenome TaxID=1070528 RepID=A0A6M3LJZ3_9ZZZZ
MSECIRVFLAEYYHNTCPNVDCLVCAHRHVCPAGNAIDNLHWETRNADVDKEIT